MNKKLFIQLLDIAYPNNELPLNGEKIAHLFGRFNNTVSGFTLTDDGKITVNDTFICDIDKGAEYLDLALREIKELTPTIILKTTDPKQKHLLIVIREMNKSGRIISKVQPLTKEMFIYFTPASS